MRILHIIESLDFGGAEKVLVELANGMLGRCQVAICCIKLLGPLRSQLDPRISVYCLNQGEGNHYRLPLEIAKLIRDGKFDVVHSHSWGVYLEAALGAVLARAQVLVHTVHGNYLTYPPQFSSRVKMSIRHTLEHLLGYAHRKIVTVSDAIQHYVHSDIRIPASRLVTIHNGIQDAALSRHAKPADAELVFISVGRLAAVKNIPMMLRAFARLRQRVPHSRLQIVGDGPERGALERLAQELGISPRVSFLGFLTSVDQLLAQADVFVMSSRYEGISIALLEAMRAGLPVIATRVGGMAETVRDGESGLLVPDGDDAAMTGAMARLADSAVERRRMGESGHAYLRCEFSLAATLEQYYRIYES